MKIFISDTPQPIADLEFTLQYLKVIKLIGRIWTQFMFPVMIHSSSAVGKLKILFRKLDKSMRDIRYRFLGLNKEAELHILELIIVSCTLKIFYAKAGCSAATLKKLYSTVSCVEQLHRESSLELSSFIVELEKILREISPTDGAAGTPVQLQKSLEYFSLKQFELSGTQLKHVKAELVVCNNCYENPLSFIFGLPVGIPFEIKLYNVSCESRLWLKMTLAFGEEKIQFVFLDLDGVSSYDEIKKFTFVAPFYGIPNVPCFTLNVCVAMECSSEQASICNNNYWGPKHELMDLSRETEVYLSRLDK